MSENCEKCKASLEFPSSREVLEKKRTCPACGHSQAVHKSILYVVETLEEQNAELHARISAIEAKLGIETRPLSSPTPPRKPRISKPRPDAGLVGDGVPNPVATPSVDLFADVPSTVSGGIDILGDAQPVTTLPDLF